jgi:hypothetical protein
MKLAGEIAAGVAALIMSTGIAAAADVPQVVTSITPPPAAPTFD